MGGVRDLEVKLLGEQFLYLAKIQLLPTEHLTARVVLASVSTESTVGETWLSSVKELMSTFPVPIPCILESGLISNDDLTRARGDAKWRKILVTKYKTQVVFPALCSRDDAEFHRAASKFLLGLGVTYHDLVPQRSSQGWDWLLPLLNVEDWKLVKAWAFIRLTGKWPATWVGGSENVVTLLQCPRCHQQHFTVLYSLYNCVGTMADFLDSDLMPHVSRQFPIQCFVASLFHSSVSAEVDAARAKFVGQIILRILSEAAPL